MSDAYHLYTISFTVGSESGIALVSANSDKDAFQILKNGGSRHCDGYSLIQTRDIGMTTSCTYGLLMESFVNAKEAFDALVNVANMLVGPVGPAGPQGIQGEDGRQGVDGASLIDVEQTLVASSDGSDNEITFTLADGGERKIYIKNGTPSIETVTAMVDSLPGTPAVYTNLDALNKALSLSFYGLKGVQGDPGVNNTSMLVTEDINNEVPSAETMDIVFLAYNESTGEYDRYITQYDGEVYSFVQIGDTSLDLSEYKRIDSEVWLTQEQFDALTIKDITKTYYVYEETDEIE